MGQIRATAFQFTTDIAPGEDSTVINHEMGAYPVAVTFRRKTDGQNMTFKYKVTPGLENSQIKVSCGDVEFTGIVVTIMGLKDTSNEVIFGQCE